MAIYITDSAGKRTKVAGIGLPGPTGKSAYQYAVEGGFVGTEDEFKALLAGISNEDMLVNDYFADPIDQQNGYIVPEGTPYYQLGVVDSPVVGTLTAPVTVKRFYNTNGAPIFDLDGAEYYSAIGTEVRGYCAPGCTIDMWHLYAGLCTVGDGCITLTPTPSNVVQFYQIVERDVVRAKTVTFSVLSAAYGLVSIVCQIPGSGAFDTPNVETADFYIDAISTTDDTSKVYFRIIGKTYDTPFDIIAAKLELGSVQTLAHQDADGNWVLNSPPPNRALELAKCQSYYWESEASFSGTYYNAEWITLNQKFPVRMRCVPTITILSLKGTENTFSDGNGNDIDVQTTISGSITREGIMSIGTTSNPNGQGGTYNYRIIADARL